MLSSGGEGILLKISLHLLVTVNNADWWVIIGISVTVKWQQLETATRLTCELYIVYTHLFNLVLRDVHRQLGKHITWHHLVDWDLGSNKTARAHPENKFGGALSLPLFSFLTFLSSSLFPFFPLYSPVHSCPMPLIPQIQLCSVGSTELPQWVKAEHDHQTHFRTKLKHLPQRNWTQHWALETNY